MSEEIAIKVDNVSKDFVLPHSRANSIKGMFTGLVGSKQKPKQTGRETQHALKDISFEIKKGEFFGIVGRNGSGKSTLLKILAGIYQPTNGYAQTQGKLVPFIELGVGFNPELTGRENVYLNGAMLGFSKKQISKMYDKIVAFAELERFMDQKLKNYSSGMQVRLAFSMAVRAQADILLIDEVLAVGDADFQRKCFDYFRRLKRDKKTVVFVSHDMEAVREYCDRAILIEDSRLIEAGSPNQIAAHYTKMFIDQADTDDEHQSTKRWGDGAISYKSVTVSPTRLKPEDKELVITCQAVAKQDVEQPNFGFLVKNAAFSHIFGTNTTLTSSTPVSAIKAGETINIEWRIPNVFNDGVHYIDPSIIYQDGTKIAEWWEEAAHFTSLRSSNTPYIISPEVGLQVKRKKA